MMRLRPATTWVLSAGIDLLLLLDGANAQGLTASTSVGRSRFGLAVALAGALGRRLIGWFDLCLRRRLTPGLDLAAAQSGGDRDLFRVGGFAFWCDYSLLEWCRWSRFRRRRRS